MRIFLGVVLLVAAAGHAAAQDAEKKESGTATSEGRTRVIIGGGLGGGFGAKYKVNGQTVSFSDRFQGSPDDSPIVAVKVATFGIALAPGLYAGLDLTGVAKAGNVPKAGAPLTFDKTYLQITDYFAAVTYFPWEWGLFLKAGAGLSTFALATDSGTGNTHASGLGLLVGAGYALQLSGAHHVTLTVEQTYQSYGGSSTTKPDNSQFTSVFLGYLYKN